MRIVHIWEKIIKPIAIPNLLRTLAIFLLITFAVSKILGPNADLFLDNLRLYVPAILEGEIWRMISWIVIFIPRGGGLDFIWMIFLIFFLFFLNDVVEGAWGAIRTNAYFWACVVTIVIASFVEHFVIRDNLFQPYIIPFLASRLLLTSVIVAASLIAPFATIHLFAIIPVQMRFIGIFSGAYLILITFEFPFAIPFILIGMATCLGTLIPVLYKAFTHRAKTAHRRSKFEAGKNPDNKAFHTCSICNTTDITDPDLTFRVINDGSEICETCLENQKHIPDK